MAEENSNVHKYHIFITCSSVDGHPDWLVFEKKNMKWFPKFPPDPEDLGDVISSLSLYDRAPSRNRTDETAVGNDSGQHFTASLHSAEFSHPHPLPGRAAYFLRVVYKWFSTKPTARASVIHREEMLLFEIHTLTSTQNKPREEGRFWNCFPALWKWRVTQNQNKLPNWCNVENISFYLQSSTC